MSILRRMRVLFILNSSKNKTADLYLLLDSMKPLGFHFEYAFTLRKGHAKELAEQYCHQYDCLVPVGGDGTIHECVNALAGMQAKNKTTASVLLAPWPMGTGNDFSRNFDWRNSAHQLIDRLKNVRITTVDLGVIQYADRSITYFMNECSAGLGPSVVDRVEKMPKALSGNIKFGLAILRTFISYQKINVQLSCDEMEWSGKCMAIVVANGKYFGSGLGIAPYAILNDGYLDVTVIGNVTLLEYLKYLPQLKKCQPIIHPEVRYFKTKKIRLMAGGNLEHDGESGENAMVTIKVAPHCLSII